MSNSGLVSIPAWGRQRKWLAGTWGTRALQICSCPDTSSKTTSGSADWANCSWTQELSTTGARGSLLRFGCWQRIGGGEKEARGQQLGSARIPEPRSWVSISWVPLTLWGLMTPLPPFAPQAWDCLQGGHGGTRMNATTMAYRTEN